VSDVWSWRPQSGLAVSTLDGPVVSTVQLRTAGGAPDRP